MKIPIIVQINQGHGGPYFSPHAVSMYDITRHGASNAALSTLARQRESAEKYNPGALFYIVWAELPVLPVSPDGEVDGSVEAIA